MITEKDLQEAIAECQGVRNPNANTAIKLAAFLTIQREMFGNSENVNLPQYSYAAPPVEPAERTIEYYSDSEFSKAIDGKDMRDVWPVIDELMTTVQQLYPRLYAGVMRELGK